LGLCEDVGAAVLTFDVVVEMAFASGVGAIGSTIVASGVAAGVAVRTLGVIAGATFGTSVAVR
jgi:hypothetical protein